MTKRDVRRVLLIGWDGADWQVIHPLLDAGKMPNLARLVEEGTIGNLATLRPQFSPMLWTSIATGKRPFRHGILGFVEPDPTGPGVRPVSVLSRRTKALWNILGQEGRRSAVVGWWPSHPAEPIRGVMVSEQFGKVGRARRVDRPMPAGAVHPPELLERLEALKVWPEEVDESFLLPFVPDAARVDQTKDVRLDALARILCECVNVHSAATAVMQNEEWDFLAVYYDAIDHFSHGFMPYHPPRLPWVDEAEFELYRHVVEGAYRFHDMMLGTLLHHAGEEATVVLVSDHGFRSDELRPRELPNEPAAPAAQHRPLGIFAVKGPGIRRDERVYGASLLDVTPTILAACGLPVGADMDGKVLVDVFETPPEVRTIPSWDDVPGEDGSHPADRRSDPLEGREALEQLVALGYIERPPADDEQAVAEAARELRYNLARAYADAQRIAEAAEILSDLREQWPLEHRFGLELVRARLRLGQAEEARRIFEDVLALKREDQELARSELVEFRAAHPPEKGPIPPAGRRRLKRLRVRAGENSFAVEVLSAVLTASRKHEEALASLERAERIDDGRPDLHVLRGDVLVRLHRHDEAVASYDRALAIDSEDPVAWLGRARALLGARRSAAAADAALRSIGLLYHNPLAHTVLGIALQRRKRIDDARAAFELALRQNPRNPLAHARLAHLFEHRLGDPERAREHAEKARELRRDASRRRREARVPAPRSARPADVSLAPAGIESPAAAPPADPTEMIVVVSGLPRSGTSMMMQMLAAGGFPVLADDARAADEGNPRGYFELEAAKSIRRDASFLDGAKGRAVKLVAPLFDSLPSAGACRVVFMERDLSEVVASQRALLARSGKAGARIADERLAAELARQAREVRRRLAEAGVPVLAVSHRETMESPRAVAERVNRFLGGVLDEEKAAAAVDPSLHRHRGAAPRP